MSKQNGTDRFEADPRIRSGLWVGYWIQGCVGGVMHLRLTFDDGTIHGEGRDAVGPFIVHGHYGVPINVVYIRKHYLRRNTVLYEGFAEHHGHLWG